ncbi:MAG: O-antigen ligase family protein [Ignavibacteriaceae bacterium]
MKSRNTVIELLSLTGLILYLGAVLFGTSGPQWPQKLEDVSDMVMSNPVNQVVFSTIFVLSFFSVLPHYKKFLYWLNREKFIVFFLLWCGITILWAIDPVVAFKRYFQYLTTSIVFISVLINFKDEKIILKTLTIILSIYLFVTLIVVLTIPQATDPSFNTWRGLHSTKNNLGQTAGLSIIFFFTMLLRESELIKKITLSFFLFIAVILLFGSFSMTNILLIMIFFILFIVFKSNKLFEPLGIKNKTAYLIISFALIILLVVLALGSDLYSKFFEFIGKDPTLTGRTEIWSLVLASSTNLITGVGFQSFWIPEHLSKIILFQYWIPTQSHNGYVDIILETGFVGLFLFLFVIYSFVKKLKIKGNKIWVLIVIYTLLLNFSESTLIRPHHYTNVFFYLSFWVVSFKKHFNSASDTKS